MHVFIHIRHRFASTTFPKITSHCDLCCWPMISTGGPPRSNKQRKPLGLVDEFEPPIVPPGAWKNDIIATVGLGAKSHQRYTTKLRAAQKFEPWYLSFFWGGYIPNQKLRMNFREDLRVSKSVGAGRHSYVAVLWKFW